MLEKINSQFVKCKSSAAVLYQSFQCRRFTCFKSAKEKKGRKDREGKKRNVARRTEGGKGKETRKEEESNKEKQ